MTGEVATQRKMSDATGMKNETKTKLVNAKHQI